MSYTAHTARYLESDVLSRSKEWLVPLLYEHLVASLRRASVQIETGDLEGKAASLEKASAIVLELRGSLDFENGGEIAPRLAALYSYFASEIISVGRTLDTAHLARLIDMASSLHETWVQAAEMLSPQTRGGMLASKIA
jgi:flagellar protein FliS